MLDTHRLTRLRLPRPCCATLGYTKGLYRLAPWTVDGSAKPLFDVERTCTIYAGGAVLIKAARGRDQSLGERGPRPKRLEGLERMVVDVAGLV